MRIDARPRTGYLATVIGAVAGVLIGMAMAYFLVLAYVSAVGVQYFHGGEVVLLILLGIPGIWIGATVGCWLALRLGHHTEARHTGYQMARMVPLVVLLPPTLMLWFNLSGSSFLFLPLLGVVAAAGIARSLALRR